MNRVLVNSARFAGCSHSWIWPWTTRHQWKEPSQSRPSRSLLRLRCRLTDNDRGSVAIWVAVTTPALLLLLVLLVDGGAKFTAGEQASSYAAEAARAAAIAVGPQPAAADARIAVSAANSYLASAGVRGTATITGPASVTVSVTVVRTAPISGVQFAITRSATAQLLIGVETGHAP